MNVKPVAVFLFGFLRGLRRALSAPAGLHLPWSCLRKTETTTQLPFNKDFLEKRAKLLSPSCIIIIIIIIFIFHHITHQSWRTFAPRIACSRCWERSACGPCRRCLLLLLRRYSSDTSAARVIASGSVFDEKIGKAPSSVCLSCVMDPALPNPKVLSSNFTCSVNPYCHICTSILTSKDIHSRTRRRILVIRLFL